MGLNSKEASLETPTSAESLQSIARLLSLLVKLKIREAQGDRKLNEMILLLHSFGCRPIEIAEALGKTPNDVNPVISRARKSVGSRKPNRRA
jgi:DNA-directed RNA polymerase specialized sigma24 family protein